MHPVHFLKNQGVARTGGPDAAFDHVVVGAGVMGAATARVLAKAGARVLLLEQFRLGHKRGSSHGASRIFRFSYPDPRYVTMAQEALPLWRELERESDHELLTTTGGYDAGHGVEANAAALRAAGARYELIDGAEACRRHPFLALPPHEPVLFQPEGGFARAEATIRALVSSAVAHGAVLREDTAVGSLSD